MKFLRKFCGLGFCGLKLKIGRGDVNHPFPAKTVSPIPLPPSGSPSSPLPASGSPKPCPGTDSPLSSPDLIFRSFGFSPPIVTNPSTPAPSPNPTPTPSPNPTPTPIRSVSPPPNPSPTLSPNPATTPSPNRSPIPTRSLSPLSLVSDQDLDQPNLNPSLDLDPADLNPFVSFPLGSFRSDITLYDSGSSVALSYYPISPLDPPLGEDDMEEGVVGVVFNFPHKVLRTSSRVVHISNPELVIHSGEEICADPGEEICGDGDKGPEGVVFPFGGTIHVGNGGAVYLPRWTDMLEAPDGAIVAIPIGGFVRFFFSSEELALSLA